MIEAASLIDKPVLSVSSSCIIGRVTDVYFDEYFKNAVYLCIMSDSPALLPIAEVQSFSDALIVEDVGLVSPLDVDITALKGGVLGMPVYTLGGLSKGNVCDITLTAAGKVSKLRLDGEEISPSQISKIGDVILLKAATKSKPKARKIPRPEIDYPVYALCDGTSEIAPSSATQLNNADVDISADAPLVSDSAISATTIDTNADAQTCVTPQIATVQIQPKPAVSLGIDVREPVLSDSALKALLDGSDVSFDDDAHTPTRVICDYEFLLGRRLGSDLCTYTGELIAVQGSEVNSQIVEKARRAGKLVELTLNSIKPDSKPQNN